MNGDSARLTRDATLTYRENNLAFEYSLLSYFRESETRYRTQLVGLESAASDWSAENKRSFTTLPAGSYTFSVWAKDYAGNESGPLEERFSVRPPPWATWWAFVLYLLIATAVTVGVVRWRLQALQLRAKELEQKVAERTEQLDQQNKELVSKNDELVESYKNADRIFSALADALLGTVLDGKYRLEEKIGEGGFGAVFRTLDLVNDRTVATKVFRPSAGNDSAAALERFRQEGTSASRVSHKNAVAVYDSGVTADGIAYLVMEYLAGVSLAKELEEKIKLPLERSLAIAIPICDALAEAHKSGIVHRDIKPDNIVLNRLADGSEVVKVIDFGVAKLTERDVAQKTLTMTGAVVGTHDSTWLP